LPRNGAEKERKGSKKCRGKARQSPCGAWRRLGAPLIDCRPNVTVTFGQQGVNIG